MGSSPFFVGADIDGDLLFRQIGFGCVVGQWNTFTIKMVGSRVWITLNGKPTVEGQVLDNYFDRKAPLVARGPIELQTHGSEIRFRNIFVREIPAAEAKATLDKLAK